MRFNPIDHIICLNKPTYFSGKSAWVEHLPFAFWIISVLRPKVFVELGTHYGDSYFSFCQALKDLNVMTSSYAIDTWQGDEHAGIYGPELLQSVRQYHDSEYASFSRLIQTTFDQAVFYFQDESIDLLHIDGLHTYEAVKHDFATWLPKMSQSGIVLFHDTNVRERNFGVWRFWGEIREKYPNHEFIHGHGLGILAVGEKVSQELILLLKEDSPDKPAFSKFFSSMGGFISRTLASDALETEVSHLTREIQDRDTHIADLTQTVASLEATISDLNREAQDRERQIAELNLLNKEKDNQLFQLDLNIQSILSSTSYQITRPLRKIGKHLPLPLKRAIRRSAKAAYWILSPHKIPVKVQQFKIRKLKSKINFNNLFDKNFYLQRYPDVAANHQDPIDHYLLFGFKEGRDPNPLFDTDWYLSQNPDVVESGVNPLQHYIEFGAKVGSDLSPLSQKPPYYDVIFAIGCWEGESKRYRVYNISEGLAELGYNVHVISFEHIADLAQKRVKASVVVIFRAAFHGANDVDTFLNYSKFNKIKVIFDVDDLIFEPEIVNKNQIDGLRYLSSEEQQLYIEGVHGYRKLMLCSDIVTVPTEYLRGRVEALGKTAFVIPNSLNREQFSISEKIIKNKRIPNEIIRIGYFSGSKTHQADFEKCAGALLDIMQEHSNVILRIVGYLDLDERWGRFLNRIERMHSQPYQNMMHSLSECDINIAPLDIDSIFCQAKSELKFFEAGLLGIPTIASATDPFLKIIKNNINGFCAKNHEEWKSFFEILISSKTIRESIGTKAKEISIEKYSYKHIAKKAIEVYGLRSLESSELPGNNTKYLTSNPLRIAWVVPDLIIGGGGHRNILRTAYYLSQFGHQISLYFIGTNKDPEVIKREIKKHFYPLDCPVYLFENNIHSVDVVFATHWSTVSSALTAKEKTLVMYFVQDYEPFFSPMSSEYILAENTYRMGLYHITSGPWCENILKRDFNADADHFKFSVDRSIYYPRTRTKHNKNIIFFAKPEMPRRCFDLGIMTLNEFHRLRPEVEIIMFGSNEAAHRSYKFPVTILGVLPTLENLAKIYSNADVGLVFSTTNPSLIPYEMMACGLPVVDLDRGHNSFNYDNRSDIVLLANPLPEKMAIEISQLIGDDAELELRRKNGLEFVAEFPSEEAMVKSIESLILSRVKHPCPTCGSRQFRMVSDHQNLLKCLFCSSFVNKSLFIA